MKKISIIAIASLAVLALSSSVAVKADTTTAAANAPAATTANSESRPNHAQSSVTLANVYTQLDLSSDQKDKITDIIVERKNKLNALMNDPSLTPEQRRAKQTEIRDQANDSIKNLLTPDQLLQAENIIAERTYSYLNLTPQQQAQAGKILQDTEAQISAIRSNASMSENTKRANERELRTKEQKAFLDILTTEQRDLYTQHTRRRSTPPAFVGNQQAPAANNTAQAPANK